MNARIYLNTKGNWCYYVTNSSTDRFRVPTNITNKVVAESKRSQLEKLLPLSKRQVTQFLNGQTIEETDKHNFFDVFNNFLRKTEIEKQWEYSTLIKFQCLKSNIIKVYGDTIYLEDIDSDWIFNYIRKRNITNKNTTVDKEVRLMKQFFRWITKNHIYDCSQLIDVQAHLKKTSRPNIVYLTKSEIVKLTNATLSSEHLNRTRDIFLFSCMTGLRYSDNQMIGKSNIVDRLLRFTTKKTSDTLYIPLNDIAYGILVKYDYNLPKISNQVYNRFIKQVMKEAGINAPTTLTYYKGNLRLETTKPKYEWISSHSARKTFISNLLMSGVGVTTVMSMSGHKSFETMKSYIGVADEAKTEAVQNLQNIFA